MTTYRQPVKLPKRQLALPKGTMRSVTANGDVFHRPKRYAEGGGTDDEELPYSGGDDDQLGHDPLDTAEAYAPAKDTYDYAADEAEIPQQAQPAQYAKPEALPLEPWKQAQPKQSSLPLEPWLTAQPKQAKQPEMPGIWDAGVQGVQQSIKDVTQTVTGSTAAPGQESPAAAPWDWSDLTHPGNILPKAAYGLGHSAPSLVTGVAGGVAGGALAGPVGAIAGGAGGAALGTAVQELGPVFQRELAKSPNDPDAAWSRTEKQVAISAGGSAASWALFGANPFKGEIKNLIFQAVGVQPGAAVATQATQNVAAGDDITQGLGQAAVSGAVGTALPAAGHMAVRGVLGRGEAAPDTSALRNADLPLEPWKQAEQDTGNKSTVTNVTPDNSPNSDPGVWPRRPGGMGADTTTEAPSEPVQAAIRAADSAGPGRPDTSDFLPSPENEALNTGWRARNLQPEIVSDSALQADPLFARYRSAKAQEQDAIIHEGEQRFDQWNRVPEPDRIKFMDDMESGIMRDPSMYQRNPWMQNVGGVYKKMLDQAYQDEAKYGSRSDYFENYFPHLWTDPAKARSIFGDNGSMAQSHGPDWFQKARTYDTIQEGLQAGLKLKSTNPEALVNDRLLSGNDMRQKMELLQNLQDNGLAYKAGEGPAEVTRSNSNPWQTVKAPDGKQWQIAPDVQPLWKNAVEARGLWSREDTLGSAFKGWMAFKNAWVPIKLGISAFHPIHVAGIDLANNLRRGIREAFSANQQTAGQRAAAIPRALKETFVDPIKALPVGFSHEGKAAREAWKTPRNEQTPEQRAVVDAMTMGGFSPELSAQIKIAAGRKFNEALQNVNIPGIAWHGIRRVIEGLQKPIFEEWIPNLKSAAYLRELASLSRMRPDIMNNPAKARLAARTIGKSIDNRFGEMFYGSMFWNRTMKDIGQASFLSLGWNTGFVREFGGAGVNIAKTGLRAIGRAPVETEAQRVIRAADTKVGNAASYIATSMMIGGLITYASTGQTPSSMLDYIFPRRGGKNPDGSDRRYNTQSFIREPAMLSKNVEDNGGWGSIKGVIGGIFQTALHKSLAPSVLEAITNRNYFGEPMYDENANPLTQAYQFGKNTLKEQFLPMSVTGADRSLTLSGKPSGLGEVVSGALHGDKDVIMPFLGYGPAPAYASRSAIENQVTNLYTKHVAPSEKPYDDEGTTQKQQQLKQRYLAAVANGDRDNAAAARKELLETGYSPKSLAKLKPGGGTDYMFSRLPTADQQRLLSGASRADFMRFYKSSSKSTKMSPAVRDAYQRLNNSGG